MVYDAAMQTRIEADIKAGRGCATAVAKFVKTQPGGKAWLASLRTQRKHDLIATSGAIMGQLTQEGFKIHSMSDIKVMKTGNESVSLRMVKVVKTAEQKEIESLRAEVAKLLAAAAKK